MTVKELVQTLAERELDNRGGARIRDFFRWPR